MVVGALQVKFAGGGVVVRFLPALLDPLVRPGGWCLGWWLCQIVGWFSVWFRLFPVGCPFPDPSTKDLERSIPAVSEQISRRPSVPKTHGTFLLLSPPRQVAVNEESVGPAVFGETS